MLKPENQLLEMLGEETLNQAPLRQLVQALYLQVIQTQIITLSLESEVKKLTVQMKRMNEALSQKSFIRTQWVQVRYNKRLAELMLGKDFRMDFANSAEADLLELMFITKTHKPRATKWQCVEVAERFKAKNYDQLDTARKVYKAVHRIRERIRLETQMELIKLTPTEFYWFNPN